MDGERMLREILEFEKRVELHMPKLTCSDAIKYCQGTLQGLRFAKKLVVEEMLNERRQE